MNKDYIIEIKNLVKIYKGSDIAAVNNLNIRINKGEIFGLLGPNGAGKTTTISILCGLINKTSGEALVSGYNIDNELNKIKSIIGVVPQEIALYPSFTAYENLKILGTIYNIPKNELKEKIEKNLREFGLDNNNKRISKFSGGMKRRLNLIAGILHNPEILFLDEPTVGIDVQSKAFILENLKKINDMDTTIIYTSHYLEEAENLCHNIGIIDNGEIIAEGNPAELIKKYTDANSLEDVYLKLTGHKLRD